MITERRNRTLTRHLPADQQLELAARAQAGDTAARDLLIETNMGVINHIAHRTNAYKHGADLDDLTQEGAMGFARGIELFRPGAGSTVASYCGRHAEASMIRWWEKAGRTIRLPWRVYNTVSGAADAAGSSLEERARAAGVSAERLAECERAIAQPAIPYDAPTALGTPLLAVLRLAHGDDGARQEDDLVAAIDERREFERLLHAARLTETERGVVVGMFVHDKTQAVIADTSGVSRQRVGQIWTTAKAKLRRAAARKLGHIA